MNEHNGALKALTDRLQPGEPRNSPRGTFPDAGLAFRAMTSKRWRRSALSEYSSDDTLSKIQRALDNQRELVFSIPFGGYKSWRISSSPLPNWAEVFFVDYLRRFLREVNSAFPYGVSAEFTYISGVMDIVSNHPPEWQLAYIAAMEKLLSYYSDVPGQMTIVDIAGLTSSGDARLPLLRNYEENLQKWDPEDLTAEQENKLRSAERNFAVEGVEDLRSLDSHELDLRVLTSAIMCDSLDSLADRRTYNKFGPRIQLVFGRDPQPALHIGSCETSTLHFWVAEGLLEYHGERALPRMLGHSNVNKDGPGRTAASLSELDTYRAGIGSWLPEKCEVV